MKQNRLYKIAVAFLATGISFYSTLVVAQTEGGETENALELSYPVIEIPNITQGGEPYFSPDSKSLIYSGLESDESVHHTYTIKIDGTDRKRINNKGSDACTFYHPNGKNLIWTSTRDNLHLPEGNWNYIAQYPVGAELYLSDLNGDHIKRLTFNEYYDAEVGYSPDGSKILFARSIDAEMDLWLMDPDGKNERRILHTPDLQEGGSQFMPDSKTILFRAWKKSDEDKPVKDMHLYTINDDGTNLQQITTQEGSHWAPFPAPDGIHAVYAKKVPIGEDYANYELYLINLQTKEEIRLTDYRGFDGFPSISPDGKYVAFTSNRPKKGSTEEKGKNRLFLLDISSLNVGPVK
ncbi:MAG: hypothetical protein LBT25_10395 [Candidatus Symbiothrix sp.]|jgi:Tol biopolymer transport system component|nr:hypothetical protein [Candidatus Symbiothrix sp.]